MVSLDSGYTLQGSLGHGSTTMDGATGLKSNLLSESVYSDIGLPHLQETSTCAFSFGGKGVDRSITTETSKDVSPIVSNPIPSVI
jgi:hypothetical protein